MQIDKGLIHKFNVFAGVKAGIQVSGALNWAPPQEVVALSAYPVLSISGKQELSRTSSWLTLARLTAEVGAAAGIGAQGVFALSLHNGRLILYLKAALISGPGASGSFRFEVGYDAIVDILNLFRRELHRNNNQPLKWVDPAAADYLSKMTVIGALGLDPGMVYLMAYDRIIALFEALTSAGRGTHIANTITNYKDSQNIKAWVVKSPSDALGPLLFSLTSSPQPIEIEAADGKKIHLDKSEAWFLQQRAINSIIAWIAETSISKSSQTQFIESCIKMNKFGTAPPDQDAAYCENKEKLDLFMKEPALKFINQWSDTVRNQYKDNTEKLGIEKYDMCRNLSKRKPVITLFGFPK